MLDAFARFCQPRGLAKDLDELQHVLERATRNANALSPSTEAKIRNIARRLGQARINELVADYQGGMTTVTLMPKYALSKTSVIQLLESNGVTLRRQGLNDRQVRLAVALYKEGESLSTLTVRLEMPRESIRRSLIDAGVSMRSRGRKTSSHRRARPDSSSRRSQANN